jgi:chromosomal replication initiation ATPase DnaA
MRVLELGRIAAWRIGPRTPLERLAGDEEAGVIVRAVARARGVAVERLLAAERGCKQIAEARQLGMYLVHTLLSRNYLETGEVFGRDRTTVSHACAHIEDLRESRRFDAAVCRLEAEIEALRQAPEVLRAAG